MRVCRGPPGFAAIVLLLCSPAFAADFFVSPSGNDANPGTQAEPWKTITYAVSVSLAAPGDIIRVLPGTYEEIVPFKKSGSTEKPLLLLSSEWGKAVIKGGVDLGASCVWLQGFDIQPASKQAADAGGRFCLVNVTGKYDKVLNCLVHDNNFVFDNHNPMGGATA